MNEDPETVTEGGEPDVSEGKNEHHNIKSFLTELMLLTLGLLFVILWEAPLLLYFYYFPPTGNENRYSQSSSKHKCATLGEIDEMLKTNCDERVTTCSSSKDSARDNILTVSTTKAQSSSSDFIYLTPRFTTYVQFDDLIVRNFPRNILEECRIYSYLFEHSRIEISSGPESSICAKYFKIICKKAKNNFIFSTSINKDTDGENNVNSVPAEQKESKWIAATGIVLTPAYSGRQESKKTNTQKLFAARVFRSDQKTTKRQPRRLRRHKQPRRTKLRNIDISGNFSEEYNFSTISSQGLSTEINLRSDTCAKSCHFIAQNPVPPSMTAITTESGRRQESPKETIKQETEDADFVNVPLRPTFYRRLEPGQDSTSSLKVWARVSSLESLGGWMNEGDTKDSKPLIAPGKNKIRRRLRKWAQKHLFCCFGFPSGPDYTQEE